MRGGSRNGLLRDRTSRCPNFKLDWRRRRWSLAKPRSSGSFAIWISPLKKSLHAAEQDRPDVAAARKAWRKMQMGLDPRKLVFIDETSASTNMTRRYGRGTRGRTARLQDTVWPLENLDLHCGAAPQSRHRALCCWMGR